MQKRLPVRDRLIETASKLFYNKGYNRTGINEILKKSGVAKASMYQHFRSKEEICLEYLRQMDKGLMTDIDNYLQSLPKGKERILGIFDFLKQFFHSDGFRGCWCLNTISEMPRDDEMILGEIRKQKKAFRSYLRQLIENNSDATDVERLTNRMYLLYEGALIECQVHMAEWPIKDARDMGEAIL